MTEPAAENEPAAKPEQPAVRALSQADIDEIVEARLKRERKKYEDYDDLKAAAEKLAQIEAENQSEMERAIARAEKAESQLAETQASMAEERIRSAIISEASKKGAADPADIALLISRDGIALEDGKVTGVQDAVQALAEAKPSYFAGTDEPGPADAGARFPAPPPGDHDPELQVGQELYGMIRGNR